MGSGRERDECEGGDTLRDRYESLKLLRLTQPEREASAALKALEKATTASDALVASLRKQIVAAGGTPTDTTAADEAEQELVQLRADNASLRAELDSAPSASATTPAGSRDGRWRPVEEVARLEERLAFYEMMTGISVEMSGQTAKCVVRCADPDEQAAARTAAFELQLAPAEGEEGEVEYVPTDLSELPPDQLPEYLRDTITFDREQAPGFLSRLLAGVAGDD